MRAGQLVLTGAALLLPLACNALLGIGDLPALPDDAGVDAGADAPVNESSPENGVSSPGIAFVQQTAQDFGAAPSGSVTLPGVAAHDAIVVVVTSDAPASVSVSDSAGSDYAPVDGPTLGEGGSATIFAAFGVAAGDVRVTAAIDGGTGGTYLLLYAHEYRGLTSFDVGSWKNGASAATDGMTTSIETSAANELLFAYGFSFGGTVTAGSGFSPRSSFSQNVTEDRVTGAAGSWSATATANGSAWQILAAAFGGK
jgi:hypothetical protein